MPRTRFRLLFALILVVLAAGGPRAGALPNPICFNTGPGPCEPCGPDLRKRCTQYFCTDGTSRTSCTECSLFCQED